MVNPRRFMVSYRDVIEAESAEDAAREFHRLRLVGRPTVYDVTHGSSGTIFVKVKTDGSAERVA